MSEPKPIQLPRRVKDLHGLRFGRLKVVSYAGVKGRDAYWNCECDCGNLHTTKGGLLRSGEAKSCGCALRDYRASITTHYMTKTSEFTIWQGMQDRCHNPSSKDWSSYGGRGIVVCDHWRESFENFYADMGPKPHGHSLDRKDPNGNYEPDNCRWATSKTQQRNRRVNVMLTVNGETKCLSEWAEAKGITIQLIKYRMGKGMTPEQVVAPAKKYRRRADPCDGTTRV